MPDIIISNSTMQMIEANTTPGHQFRRQAEGALTGHGRSQSHPT